MMTVSTGNSTAQDRISASIRLIGARIQTQLGLSYLGRLLLQGDGRPRGLLKHNLDRVIEYRRCTDNAVSARTRFPHGQTDATQCMGNAGFGRARQAGDRKVRRHHCRRRDQARQIIRSLRPAPDSPAHRAGTRTGPPRADRAALRGRGSTRVPASRAPAGSASLRRCAPPETVGTARKTPHMSGSAVRMFASIASTVRDSPG
ncbi:hypothetical protein DL89DRAFT_184012 [Linderina pennispora]|uniref:Uncharacterized protein n=1 Tax=Linderina pennispora TaxID=61395 RepID=A0A1Y1W5H5_9FUNG|nr:uncharacterized protein DL89DRAFT_184012 [Linderina pennispora]ORX68791.1 hypothetical protein DL89DRAFT_184012 [Linderina pennispora]